MDDNNFLKQLLLIGIGTTSLVADKLRDVSEEWVRTGRLDATQARDFVDDFLQQFKTDQDNLEAMLQRQMRNILQDMGVARQSEVDELRGRIDRLERQVRALEERR
ncbi:MAG: phasin family protein [Cyanobacteria bacterium P01_H01_bin.121]